MFAVISYMRMTDEIYEQIRKPDRPPLPALLGTHEFPPDCNFLIASHARSSATQRKIPPRRLGLPNWTQLWNLKLESDDPREEEVEKEVSLRVMDLFRLQFSILILSGWSAAPAHTAAPTSFRRLSCHQC